MEQVLDLYSLPYNPELPLICMDEASKQLIEEIYAPIKRKPGTPGTPEKYDYHYKRNGVQNMFMFFEPLKGFRKVILRDQKTKEDWTYCMKFILDEFYQDLEKVIVVSDNLKTHNLAAFYEFFAPAEAKRLVDKIQLEPTPKRGSWLNMAEIAIGDMKNHLKDRIPNKDDLAGEIKAWEDKRNSDKSMVNWQFTSDDARIKLKHLYPSY